MDGGELTGAGCANYLLIYRVWLRSD